MSVLGISALRSVLEIAETLQLNHGSSASTLPAASRTCSSAPLPRIKCGMNRLDPPRRGPVRDAWMLVA